MLNDLRGREVCGVEAAGHVGAEVNALAAAADELVALRAPQIVPRFTERVKRK